MGSNYYSLLRALTVADFKLRYRGSILGVFWSLLKPLFLFTVLYVVFAIFIRVPIPHYGLYLLLGLIVWTFFAEATTFSIKNLSQKAPLIRKIYFPRSILTLSSTLLAFINFLASLSIFLVIFLLSGLPWSWSMFTALFWLTELFFLALGFGFALSALNIKMKDIEHIWEVLLPLGLWVTPITYSISMVPAEYRWLITLNPIAIIIENVRNALLGGSEVSIESSMIVTLVVIAIFIMGYSLFEASAPSFAEEL